MAADIHPKRQLTQLNREIEQAEAELERLRQENKILKKDRQRLAMWLHYLRAAHWVRRPTSAIDLWPLVLLALGPMLVGILALVAIRVFGVSLNISLLGFLIVVVASGAATAMLLFRPTNQQLEPAISEAQSSLRLADARASEKALRISDVADYVRRLVEERRHQVATGKLQRAALLQRNWKRMAESEWEDFVIEVFRTLGATAERLRESNEGANFIANFENRRVAVVTNAAEHNISSATIRRAIDAKMRHNCDGCAVVVNRRFTGAAQDFARHNGCLAIGNAEFPDFVLGKIEI